MNEVKQIGNLTDNANRENPNRNRLYDIEGIAPTLCKAMGGGGNLVPLILCTKEV